MTITSPIAAMGKEVRPREVRVFSPGVSCLTKTPQVEEISTPSNDGESRDNHGSRPMMVTMVVASYKTWWMLLDIETLVMY